MDTMLKTQDQKTLEFIRGNKNEIEDLLTDFNCAGVPMDMSDIIGALQPSKNIRQHDNLVLKYKFSTLTNDYLYQLDCLCEVWKSWLDLKIQ